MSTLLDEEIGGSRREVAMALSARLGSDSEDEAPRHPGAFGISLSLSLSLFLSLSIYIYI